MQFLLDNVTASVIAGVFVLMMATLQLRAQEVAIEQAAFYRVKRHTLSFADFISDEFPSIGEGLGKTTQEIVEDSTGAGLTWKFVFKRKIGPKEVEVAYTLVQDTTYLVDGVDVPIYRIERTLGSGSAHVVMRNLKNWRIEMLNHEGNPAGSRASARQIRVRFSCLLVLGKGEHQIRQQTFWGTTFRPTGLRI